MPKILVYDLDARFAASLKNALGSMGYEAVVANDGYSVLPLAEQHKPNLIILDYKIPEADGYEILLRLRKTTACAETPVIFASTTPKFEIEMVVMDAPGVGYLDKPLDGRKLKDAIEALLGPLKKAPSAPAPAMNIPPPGAPLDSGPAAFTGEPDLDGSRGDDVINLD